MNGDYPKVVLLLSSQVILTHKQCLGLKSSMGTMCYLDFKAVM